MGKPKPGFEERYIEIFKTLQEPEKQKTGFFDKLKGKKSISREDLLKEWFEMQIPTYETIKSPRVGRDKEADEWIKAKYQETDKATSEADFIKAHQGYYVIELAKELDGVPVYIAMGQDENVFRGQFLRDCFDILGEDLASEAWNTKLADEALDYGNRLMKVADQIGAANNLQHLKDQRKPPEANEASIEWKLHIVYSLAKWLIFYGKNGHGYEADF
jgi:hypothetical protein